MCDTLEMANASEKKWIRQFRSRDPASGFNIMRGGQHTPHPVSNHYRSDPGYLGSQRLAAEERWKDPEYQAKTLTATQDAIRTPEVRRKLSEAVSDLWKDPDYREKQHASLKESAARPEVRQKLRENWDDPSFRERCSSGPLAHIAEQSRKTHCLRGHEYTSENTVLSPDGHRECKACNYARKKAAKTHCPKGHPYDDDNVILSKAGRRICSTCLAASKVKLPCRVCGAPKDMLVSGRLRCRPCGNRRALESRRRSRVFVKPEWYVLEGDGAFRKISFILDIHPEDLSAHIVLDGPFPSMEEASMALDVFRLVEEVMES